MSGCKWPWIGVRQNKNVSDGSPISINPPFQNRMKSKIAMRLLYCNFGGLGLGKWCDSSCDNTYNSICEPTL